MWKTLHVASYRLRFSSHLSSSSQFRTEAPYRNLYIEIYMVARCRARALSLVREALRICPTTDQIKAQTKKHILGAMVYPNNVQLQRSSQQHPLSKFSQHRAPTANDISAVFMYVFMYIFMYVFMYVCIYVCNVMDVMYVCM